MSTFIVYLQNCINILFNIVVWQAMARQCVRTKRLNINAVYFFRRHLIKTNVMCVYTFYSIAWIFRLALGKSCVRNSYFVCIRKNHCEQTIYEEKERKKVLSSFPMLHTASTGHHTAEHYNLKFIFIR